MVVSAPNVEPLRLTALRAPHVGPSVSLLGYRPRMPSPAPGLDGFLINMRMRAYAAFRNSVQIRANLACSTLYVQPRVPMCQLLMPRVGLLTTKTMSIGT